LIDTLKAVAMAQSLKKTVNIQETTPWLGCPAKLVLALSETKRLFWLFCFVTEKASFGVSIELKQTKMKQFFTDCRPYNFLQPVDILDQ